MCVCVLGAVGRLLHVHLKITKKKHEEEPGWFPPLPNAGREAGNKHEAARFRHLALLIAPAASCASSAAGWRCSGLQEKHIKPGRWVAGLLSVFVKSLSF